MYAYIPSENQQAESAQYGGKAIYDGQDVHLHVQRSHVDICVPQVRLHTQLFAHKYAHDTCCDRERKIDYGKNKDGDGNGETLG